MKDFATCSFGRTSSFLGKALLFLELFGREIFAIFVVR
jgi:hypothetical protein